MGVLSIPRVGIFPKFIKKVLRGTLVAFPAAIGGLWRRAARIRHKHDCEILTISHLVEHGMSRQRSGIGRNNGVPLNVHNLPLPASGQDAPPAESSSTQSRREAQMASNSSRLFGNPS